MHGIAGAPEPRAFFCPREGAPERRAPFSPRVLGPLESARFPSFCEGNDVRGIVLLVLGGGLLWLVVTTFGGKGDARAAEPDADAAAALDDRSKAYGLG